MFSKKDLEVGMRVELRNKEELLLLINGEEKFFINDKGQYLDLSNYTESLENTSLKDYDVIKVFKPTHLGYALYFSSGSHKLVFDRIREEEQKIEDEVRKIIHKFRTEFHENPILKNYDVKVHIIKQ